MTSESKTLYIWDIANTIILEPWDAEGTGFSNMGAYVESLGYDLKTISPRDYEWLYEKPYKKGMFKLGPNKGFKDVLTWTKNNIVFTQGNREQLDWRAEYLNPRCGFDFRDFIEEINSTFDYGDTNCKTKEMLKDLLKRKYNEGFKTVVYTDDRVINCQSFIEAADELISELPDFTYRTYHIQNDNKGARVKQGYAEIGNLYDLQDVEQKLHE
ncbi:MAG: hypothetical protein WC817_04745 [Patescibacteria group bacterium]|jgi:hypothetical protein